MADRIPSTENGRTRATRVEHSYPKKRRLSEVDPPEAEEPMDSSPKLKRERKRPARSKREFKCPVCLNKFTKILADGGDLLSTPCGHVFCWLCLSKLDDGQRRCPLCRFELKWKKLILLHL